jgi:hypothetical protein
MWWHTRRNQISSFGETDKVHLNLRGASVQSTTGNRGVRISGSNGSNAECTMFRGSVRNTGYPLHSPVSPSLPLPCVTVCHHISAGLYYLAAPHLRSSNAITFAQCRVIYSCHSHTCHLTCTDLHGIYEGNWLTYFSRLLKFCTIDSGALSVQLFPINCKRPAGIA